ncbi:MAG: hypothetical protein DIU57_002200 [Pseudomonadota bacterium]
MANEKPGPFRTRLRVKSKSETVGQDLAAPPSPPRRSLMEALQQAATQTTVRPDESSDAGHSQSSPSPAKTEVISPATPVTAKPLFDEKPSRPTRLTRSSRIGRLAAARLRQLARLKEEAEGLERIVRGEVEEATVEIVHRDPRRRRRSANSDFNRRS